MRRAAAEAGFTLIEVLVALAVFSLAALTLVNLSGENARTAQALEARALAGVVAENRAVEAMVEQPPLGVTSGVDMAGDRAWRWTRSVTRTDDPEIARIDIIVAEQGGRSTLAEVSVFRGRR